MPPKDDMDIDGRSSQQGSVSAVIACAPPSRAPIIARPALAVDAVASTTVVLRRMLVSGTWDWELRLVRGPE